MSTELILLLGIGLLAGLWLEASRQHERAVFQARKLCARDKVQLLDETVALQSLRLVRHAGRLSVRRRYVFEVSLAGHDRQAGCLWLIGNQLDGFQAPWAEEAETPPAAQAGTGAVVVDLLERIARKRGD